MKEKDRSKEYTLFSNVKYIYKVLYKVKPAMKLGMYGTVFLFIAERVIGTLMLAAAVASITERGRTGHYLMVMFIMLAASLACRLGNNYLNEWSDFFYETAQNRDFLMKLVQKSLNADYDNVESPAQQRLLSRATHAVNMYRNGVNLMYVHFPLVIATVIGILLYSLTISFFDWRIIAIIAAMSAISSLIEARSRKYRAETMDEQHRIWGRFYYLKQQAISVDNGKDIRIYNMADWFRSGVDRLNNKNKALSIGKCRYAYAVHVSDALFVAARDILAYGIMVTGVLNGTFNIAEFTLGLGAVSGLAAWFGNIHYHISYLLEGNQMICEYRRMMDCPDKFMREDGMGIPLKWRETFPVIEFKNVSFRYEEDGEDILKNISFSIQPGERIALVGNNGAGKSTLVKLLCGFYHPTGGEILIGGHSLETLNLNEYHALLTVIFQDINVMPVSICSNVSGKAEEETDREKVRECLIRAGLWKDIDALKRKELTSLTQSFDPDGIQLSGGMTQKLMLARCLYKDAPVIILDEPTAALDPIAESNMYEEYKAAASGKSALFISHRLASTKFCDRILFLENGSIAEMGTHDELLARKGKYAEVFEVQSQYYKGGEGNPDEEK